MEIFDCGNHREFLKNYLAASKRGVGPRSLARKAGFKSSGHVTMLINGQRRLTPRSAELIAKGIGLKGRRRSLLIAFAKLDMSKSEKEKERIQEEILRLKSFQPEFQISTRQYSVLAIWYYPVVLTLLHIPAAPQDAAFLAQRLGRGVTATEVEKALADLSFLGLIQKNEAGRWIPSNAAMTTPQDVKDLAIVKYHRNSLMLAGDALDLPQSQREFNGLTVTIPTALMPRVKEKMRRLRTELNEMLAEENDSAEVFQIHLQVFPITRAIERKES
jgi:uncharacterized protein (TIGR02147 family)